MLFDLASDLHVDHNAEEIAWATLKNAGSRVLVLAGDTSNFLDDLRAELTVVSPLYDFVLVIDGNHEHYNTIVSVRSGMDVMREICSEFKNVIFLDGKTVFTLDGVAFIGANGWYDFRAYPDQHTSGEVMALWKDRMGDAKFLENRAVIQWGDETPDLYAVEQANDLCALVTRLTIDSSISEIVVLTHTCPDVRLRHRSGDREHDMLTGCYVNSRMADVVQADTEKKIRVWGYGHVHSRDEKVIGDIRYIDNSRGYGFHDVRWWPIQVNTEDEPHQW